MLDYITKAFKSLEDIEVTIEPITEAVEEQDNVETLSLREVFERAGSYSATFDFEIEGEPYCLFFEGYNDGETCFRKFVDFDVENITEVLVQVLDGERNFIGPVSDTKDITLDTTMSTIISKAERVIKGEDVEETPEQGFELDGDSVESSEEEQDRNEREFVGTDPELKVEEDVETKENTKVLTESESFDLGNSEDLEKAKEEIDKVEDGETAEQIVDVEAEAKEDLKKSYIGSIVLQCPECKTMIYKNSADLVKAEEKDEYGSDIYNVDEECPHCGAVDGYKLIGQIGSLSVDPEAVPEPPMVADEKPVETEPEETHEEEHEEEIPAEDEKTVELDVGDVGTNEELEEAVAPIYKIDVNGEWFTDADGNEIEFKTEQDAIDFIEEHELENAKAEISNMDKVKMDKFGQSESEKPLEESEESSDELTLDVGEVGEEPAKETSEEEIPEEGEESVEAAEEEKEIKGDIPVEDVVEIVSDVAAKAAAEAEKIVEPTEEQAMEIADKVGEVVDEVKDEILPKEDAEEEKPETEETAEEESSEDESEEETVEESCESCDKKEITEEEDGVARIEFCIMKDNNNIECFEKEEEATEFAKEHDADKVLLVKYGPKDENGDEKELGIETVWEKDIQESKEETCPKCGKAPCECEKKEECKEACNESLEEGKFADVILETFDEEKFDRLVKKYLKETYSNVDSYRTIGGGVIDETNQLVIEGIIKFNSGKEKDTKFVFEAKEFNKKGQLKLVGINEMFSNKRAFTLVGNLDNNKLLSESLAYHYTIGDKKVSGKTEEYKKR